MKIICVEAHNLNLVREIMLDGPYHDIYLVMHKHVVISNDVSRNDRYII